MGALKTLTRDLSADQDPVSKLIHRGGGSRMNPHGEIETRANVAGVVEATLILKLTSGGERENLLVLMAKRRQLPNA